MFPQHVLNNQFAILLCQRVVHKLKEVYIYFIKLHFLIERNDREKEGERRNRFVEFGYIKTQTTIMTWYKTKIPFDAQSSRCFCVFRDGIQSFRV